MAIQIKETFPLASFTTMRVGGDAHFFVRVTSTQDIVEAVAFADEKKLSLFVLGGGSNTLVSGDGFGGLVMKIDIKGVLYEANTLSVGAGEKWDDIVEGAVAQGLWGIENLSLIPGTVGGAVVQNIGAYGMEVCETIIRVEAFDMESKKVKTFSRDECGFGYRESIFKKNKNLIVMSVVLELAENGYPRATYEDVKKYLADKNISSPSLSLMREVVISIRTAKLPPPTLGTAGSFFKNPVVSQGQFTELLEKFPDIKAYELGNGDIKLSAAWLLDQAGKWKGVRRGDAGVHEKQALILVNYGNANADEIISLANEMKNSIKEKTGVVLEEEVVRM